MFLISIDIYLKYQIVYHIVANSFSFEKEIISLNSNIKGFLPVELHFHLPFTAITALTTAFIKKTSQTCAIESMFSVS